MNIEYDVLFYDKFGELIFHIDDVLAYEDTTLICRAPEDCWRTLGATFCFHIRSLYTQVGLPGCLIRVIHKTHRTTRDYKLVEGKIDQDMNGVLYGDLIIEMEIEEI